ncbi:MAG: transposase [Burkholderiales bacterium]
MVEGTGSSLEDVTEGARRATGERSSSATPPDPEVAATAKRRQFSSAEKRRILALADRCTKPGEIGALMRREGIYSSMLANWRKQREQAEHAGLAPKKRGPKPAADLAEKRRVDHLNREIARLRGRLDRAHTIIDVQKKLCTLLGLPTAEDPGEEE